MTYFLINTKRADSLLYYLSDNLKLGRANMQTYILFTKLSPEIKVKDRARTGRAWLEHVKKKCPEVNFIAHYALLGEHDFMDVYEAPNEETAAK